MRAFVALPINRVITEKIHSDFSFLSKEVNLVPPKNMHITINFFPDIKNVDFVKKRIDELLLPSFDIRLKGIGAFPSFDYIRVLYIRVGVPSFIEEELKEFSKKLGGEAFSSLHLTFARVRKRINIEKVLKVGADYGEHRINKIILYQSILSKPHPIYKEIYVKELSRQ